MYIAKSWPSQRQYKGDRPCVHTKSCLFNSCIKRDCLCIQTKVNLVITRTRGDSSCIQSKIYLLNSRIQGYRPCIHTLAGLVSFRIKGDRPCIPTKARLVNSRIRDNFSRVQTKLTQSSLVLQAIVRVCKENCVDLFDPCIIRDCLCTQTKLTYYSRFFVFTDQVNLYYTRI